MTYTSHNFLRCKIAARTHFRNPFEEWVAKPWSLSEKPIAGLHLVNAFGVGFHADGSAESDATLKEHCTYNLSEEHVS